MSVGTADDFLAVTLRPILDYRCFRRFDVAGARARGLDLALLVGRLRRIVLCGIIRKAEADPAFRGGGLFWGQTFSRVASRFCDLSTSFSISLVAIAAVWTSGLTGDVYFGEAGGVALTFSGALARAAEAVISYRRRHT